MTNFVFICYRRRRLTHFANSKVYKRLWLRNESGSVIWWLLDNTNDLAGQPNACSFQFWRKPPTKIEVEPATSSRLRKPLQKPLQSQSLKWQVHCFVVGEREPLSVFWTLEKSRLNLFKPHCWFFSVNDFVFICLKPNEQFYSKTHRSKSVLELSAIFKMISHVQIGWFWHCCHTSTTSWCSYKCWWRRTSWQSYKSCKVSLIVYKS